MKGTLKYLKPYSGTVVLGLIFKFIGAVSELLLPMVLEYVINEVVPRRNVKMIVLLGGLMLLFSLSALLSNIYANRLTVKSSGNMTHDLRYDLFERISYLKSRQVDGVGVPSLISRLTSDSYYINQMVARTLRLGVRAPILLVGGIIITFIEDVYLALVLLACLPVVAVTLYFISRKSMKIYTEVQRRGDDLVRDMQENVTGVRVIKALSKEQYEREKFDGIATRLADEEYRANKVMSLSNPLATLILNMGLVAVVIVGAVRNIEGGTILAVLSYFVIILNAMIAFTKIFVVISRGSASAQRIEQVLELDPAETCGGYPDGDPAYEIEFRDVSFSYNGVRENVNGVSFTVKRGQTLGILGGTGSGKSTLINLLMRFYDVDSGAIYVCGKDVRNYPAEELRKKFGAAFQSDFLMASSVRENVDYGRGLEQADIDRAITASQAEEFVTGLDGGLDCDLSQKAANLSGGQKQRLIIARALAGNPEICVLDDVGSALDYRTDAELRKALARYYPSSTKVVVAQRVSSVKHADLIIVMRDGEISGAGTHETLLEECEEYRQIYSAQMGEENA